MNLDNIKELFQSKDSRQYAIIAVVVVAVLAYVASRNRGVSTTTGSSATASTTSISPTQLGVSIGVDDTITYRDQRISQSQFGAGSKLVTLGFGSSSSKAKDIGVQSVTTGSVNYLGSAPGTVINFLTDIFGTFTQRQDAQTNRAKLVKELGVY